MKPVQKVQAYLYIFKMLNPLPFPEPQYLATLADGKTYVSPDYLTFYPVYITTGVLDVAVYKQVL